MIFTNIRMALTSIRAARIRSLLTMLGVVIGVSSVVVTVALGEGVKNQVIAQINQLGNDVIVIQPGTSVASQNGHIKGLSFSTNSTLSTLTLADAASIKVIPGVIDVSTSTFISGLATSIDNPTYDRARIIAASPSIETVLGQKVAFGEYYKEADTTTATAVIGSDVAADLFGQRDPIGRTFTIRGQEFSVRGVLEEVAVTPLGFGPTNNNSIYIPDGAAKKITGGVLPVSELHVKVAPGQDLAKISAAIHAAVLKSHGNQEDFSVINQTEYLKVVDQVFGILTAFVATIAGISLFVGGIGIMNIMLVSVSERTREIGVRKAVGATNRQILSQFLVESTVISLLGGLFGVLLSIAVVFLIRVSTPLHPSLSLVTLVVATGVATIVGILFGIAPAVQAARKDPIMALRHE